MKKSAIHSRAGLFLTEMIFSILVLALTSAVCIQLFASARSNQKEARNWNHIEELIISAGEIMEGTDGNPDQFLNLMPEGELSGNNLLYFYDSQWAPCSETNAVWKLTVSLSHASDYKQAVLAFQNTDGTLVHQQTIRFPRLTSKKEAN